MKKGSARGPLGDDGQVWRACACSHEHDDVWVLEPLAKLHLRSEILQQNAAIWHGVDDCMAFDPVVLTAKSSIRKKYQWHSTFGLGAPCMGYRI